MVLKFSKPKVTQLVFFIGIIFDDEEISDIIESIVIFITTTKKIQFFDINAKNKNKNKKKKNN